MTEFNIKGEAFNLQSLETDVVDMRDLLENRKTLIRSQILAIISDPSNANYIYDADLHTAMTDPAISLDTIFKAYRVEPNYALTEVVIPTYVPTTTSTITISSTVTLSIPIAPVTEADGTVRTTKNVTDMSDSEQYIMREAYMRSYIASASSSGVVLSRDNIVVYLVSGSVKVIIKVQNIETTNTTFAQQVEDFFTTTAGENSPITAETIRDASLVIISDIVAGQDPNAPPDVTDALDDPNSTLNTELSTFFQSAAFIDAVQSSSVENITLTVSADGEVEAFVIPNISGVGKGIKILPNKDSGMYVDEKRRNAIERGRSNKNIGGHESISISYQVQRGALRRARSSGYRTQAKKYTQSG